MNPDSRRSVPLVEASPTDVGGLASPGVREAESDLWVGRPSWRHYGARFALCAILAVLLVVGFIYTSYRAEGSSGWLAWFMVAIGLAVSIWLLSGVLLDILSHRYRLTSERLFLERGILSQTTDQLELMRVDDVRIHRTLVDRLMGTGTIQIVSTDASDRDVRLRGIRDPRFVAEALRERTRVLRTRSLYVEQL